MSDLQEAADKLYGEGYRDGRLEAITAVLDLVSDDELDYVSNEIEKQIERMKRQRYERMSKQRWGR